MLKPLFNNQLLSSVSWLKALFAIVLVLGIFFRFADIGGEVYSSDEVRSFLRLSGYTNEEFIGQVYTGDIVSTASLQYYQQPNSERNLNDAISALSSSPEHPPLYYLLARFFIQLFGDPVDARILSVLFALLTLPCLYWLCLELFNSSLTGWVAIALFALSPYHILLSQTARQQSLWGLAIIASSFALLRALRVKDRNSWIVYSLTLAVGLYTHLFFILTMMSHGLYLLIIERFRLKKLFFRYLTASIAALVAFIPWIVVIITNLDRIDRNTEYLRESNVTFVGIFNRLFLNIGNIFLDLYDSNRLEKLASVLAFTLLTYSIYWICRKTPREVWLFLLVLTGLTILVQLLPGQGMRSYQSRYFLTSFLGIQLLVSYAIASHLEAFHDKVWNQSFWRIVLVAVLTLGVASGVSIYQVRGWNMHSPSAVNLTVSSILNSTQRPLVISDAFHASVLALSYLTEDKVQFRLLQPNRSADWNKLNLEQNSQMFTDMFLYFPSDDLQKFVDRQPGYRRETVAASKAGDWIWLDQITPAQ